MTAVIGGVRPRRKPRRAVFNWPGAAVLLGIALVWEFVVDTGLVRFQYFPPPSQIVTAWWDVLVSGRLLVDTGHTLLVAFIGWIAGSLIGMVFGLWFGLSAFARRFGQATAELFRAAPGIAFVPVMVLIFGFTIWAEVVTVTYVCIWSVLVNSTAGAQAVTVIHRETEKTLHLSRRDSIVKIALPTAIPYIVTGMKLGLTGSLALAVVVEMTANPEGLGYTIIFFQQALEPASMMAIIVWIGVLGILLNVCFDKLTGLLGSVKASRAGQQ